MTPSNSRYLLLLIVVCYISISQQQCSCPQTNVGLSDSTNVVANTRTLLFSVQAGRSYDITLPSNVDTVTFDTCGSFDDTYLSIYTTSCTLVTFNDDSCNFQSSITYKPTTSVARVIVNGVSCGSSAFSKTVNLYMTFTPTLTFNIPDNFEPFGSSYGDTILPRCDDCTTTTIYLPLKYRYFQQYYNTIYVSNNGLVSVKEPVYAVDSDPFPQAGVNAKTPLIAPFWADVDTTPKNGGAVLYRVSTDPTPTADAEISSIFNITFTSQMTIIVTWYAVGYFPQKTDLENTFQMVMYSNIANNYTICKYIYAHNGINWVTGSGGANGFGGYPAKAGFDKGDGSTYFNLPFSGTADMQYIDLYTNINLTGVFMYRIDNKTIIDPSACVPAASCKSSVTFNVGDSPSFSDLNDGSLVCPSTNIYITPAVVTCDMYPQSSLRLHLDYFSCASTVTVLDPYPPSFPNCTSAVTNVNTDATTCSKLYTPLVQDNCGISVQPGSYLAPLGSSSHTFSTTDIAGNSVQCTFKFNVYDGVPPRAICQNIQLSLSDSGQVSVLPSQVNNNSVDNCQISTYSVSPSTLTCSNLGYASVVLNVTDIYGNSGYCTSTVNVIDSIPPTPKCATGVVIPISGTSSSMLPSQINNHSTDNCQISSITISPTTITCANTKTPLSVTLTVVDSSGNNNTCVASVMAQDVTPPNAKCKDIVMTFNTTQQYLTVVPSDINDNSSDNCGIEELAISGNDKLAKGSIGGPIVLLVTDVNGLTDTCVSYVTTPIGRTDYLVAPDSVILYVPFLISWPTTTDISDDALISLRVIDTKTLFSYPIIDNYPYKRFSYVVPNGLYDMPANRNYLIVFNADGVDYASTTVYLLPFHDQTY